MNNENEKPQTKPEDNWALSNLNISRIEYGDKQGKYTGKIKFRNGIGESFEFNIDEDLQKVLIKLISPQVSKSANEMALRLQKSITGETAV